MKKEHATSVVGEPLREGAQLTVKRIKGFQGNSPETSKMEMTSYGVKVWFR